MEEGPDCELSLIRLASFTSICREQNTNEKKNVDQLSYILFAFNSSNSEELQGMKQAFLWESNRSEKLILKEHELKNKIS